MVLLMPSSRKIDIDINFVCEMEGWYAKG